MQERREMNAKARALFDRGLHIDPNDADALAGSAYTYYVDYIDGWGNPGVDYEAKVLGQADRAIALAPDNARGYSVKGSYLSMSRRPREGLAAADAGLAINPNFVTLFVSRSLAELSLARYEQAKVDAQLAMQLSPRDPLLGYFHLQMGGAELGLGHADAAIDQLRQAIDAGKIFIVYEGLAAAYAQAGKMERARDALAEARHLNPKLTVKWGIERRPGYCGCIGRAAQGGVAEE